ncbi:hypothetical protein T484DRAFT_1841153 [Baffinella frigidus]|nr:hypothetical protein T484DRAFT_1841153 [Cryptophyta sp. CCMP2293]
MAAATKRSRGRAASPSPEKTARAGEGKATAVKGRPTPPQSSKWNNVLGAGALFVAMGLFALVSAPEQFPAVCANAAIQTEGAGAQAAAGGARQEWGSIAEIQEGIIAAAREQRFDEVGRLAVKGKQLREYEQVASEVLTEDSPLRGYSAKQRAQLDAFFSSLTMILVSELGDKTFFIAAVMAMKHPRAVVLAGALGALALMTVLSAAAGFALPNLIPREYTHSASVLLFLVFGLKLLKDAREMERSGPSEELEELMLDAKQ